MLMWMWMFLAIEVGAINRRAAQMLHWDTNGTVAM
jgi:hypothetical protein